MSLYVQRAFVFVFVAEMREAITDISIKPRQSGPLGYTSRLDSDILGPTVHWFETIG